MAGAVDGQASIATLSPTGSARVDRRHGREPWPTEFVYALAPELLVLALVVALMLLEMLRADPRWARLGMVATSAAALSLLLQQLGDGYTAAVLPGEIEIGRFAILGQDGAAAVHRGGRARLRPGPGLQVLDAGRAPARSAA